MKYIFCLILLCVNFLAFSQEKQSVNSGYITFNSGTTIEFKSLVMDAETVTYFSGNTDQETKVSKAGVKKIVDNAGTTVYESGKTNKIQNSYQNIVAQSGKKEHEKLVYESAYKLMRDGKKLAESDIESLLKPAGLHEAYKNARGHAVLGDVLMGGGLGLFIGGGISNLRRANNNESGGGPAILIAGIVIGGVGIPIKITAVKDIKSVVNQYNAIPAKNVAWYANPELKIMGSSAGIGFQLRF